MDSYPEPGTPDDPPGQAEEPLVQVKITDLWVKVAEENLARFLVGLPPLEPPQIIRLPHEPARR